MSLGDWQFVAGHYDATYNGVTIGQSKEGFKMRIEYAQRDVLVDEMGEGEVDKLQAGVRVFVDLDFVEYLRIEEALMAQFGGKDLDEQGHIYPHVGRLLTVLGAELILTPHIRTNNNQRYKFLKACVVDNVEVLLSSQLREGPVTFQCFPYNGTNGTETNANLQKKGKFYLKSEPSSTYTGN